MYLHCYHIYIKWHELAAGYLTGKWHEQPDGYSPVSCYRWLRGVRPKVCWHLVVWNPWNTPKNSFMGWLWAHDALQTKSKLLQYGVTSDADCLLCGQDTESQEHLFFACVYSRRVIQAVNQIMGGVFPTHDLLDWCMHHNGSKVWQQRNKSRVEMTVLKPEKLSKMIEQEVKDPEYRKYSRLDRFLINQDWLDAFPDMNAHFHPEGLMDHTPCIIRNIRLDGRRNASFKYFNMWGSAPEFHDIVQHTWSQQIVGTKMFGVVKKLKALKGELRKMNISCFSDVELRANQAIINLEKIQLQIEDDYDRTDLIALELQALEEVKYWSKARDSFLQQKAKTQWISEGDSNTAYFHSAIKSRCLRNKIVQIEDQRAPVTKEEIKGVVFAIPIDKAPGPDGYTSGFFRDSWDIVGDDICSAIMEFFTSGSMLNQINATNITLIPKCDRPTTVSHFRPIACCNMVYKVISKLLCNRLALVLPDIIHENQGAFIKGKSIIENVLICQDIVHLYARKAVTPRCLFKIDLQKAYDTIEWDFVEQMLHGLKFPTHFIQLVMQCVRSTTFTLSLNGSNFGYFKGQRGLRQGDPISPLLFTICMEYLSRLIKFATDRWPFQYHPLCKNLKLTHLMFADDLLLFRKGKP
ncbi:uncharacterized protein LOC141619968 [Silene latifolia]|uniref:uncharacterized protein LOC141619968 n=1 Tax=Silene latifolia TaxID=37657 RepID=UPI003D76EF68